MSISDGLGSLATALGTALNRIEKKIDDKPFNGPIGLGGYHPTVTVSGNAMSVSTGVHYSNSLAIVGGRILPNHEGYLEFSPSAGVVCALWPKPLFFWESEEFKPLLKVGWDNAYHWTSNPEVLWATTNLTPESGERVKAGRRNGQLFFERRLSGSSSWDLIAERSSQQEDPLYFVFSFYVPTAPSAFVADIQAFNLSAN